MLSKTLVKYIQNLSRKKFRDEEKLFIAEGPKVVQELTNIVPDKLKTLYATQKWCDENENILTKIASDKITIITDDELKQVSSLKTANEVLAVFHQFSELNAVETKGKLSLMLDCIQDPGNMGTMIRIADWFGIENIICSEDCVDMYNPKLIQSTMGSIARVKIIYTDIKQWLEDHSGIPSYAATLKGKNIHEMSAIKEGVIIIGNESKGISADVLNNSSEKITVPKIGKAESLNAAVAAGIILSQLAIKK